ncbi:hypothetical protein VB776_06975 [Arcicella sp. DC2W]|uniref:Uncharacterized protein n=1 Tax=Arcicella gelida TaxID=2984195 RepID=A0ABU5S2M5_9BACT|nr:hypothetical protein [Arcicella sp. DC2W]MEA5402650.1 hypothetical protein [Arcicella sp. DC2W]
MNSLEKEGKYQLPTDKQIQVLLEVFFYHKLKKTKLKSLEIKALTSSKNHLKFIEMKDKYFLLTAIWILLFFGSAISISFLTDYLQASGFFGDEKVGMTMQWDNPSNKYILKQATDGSIDTNFKWGYRHFLFLFMCWFLSVLSILKIGLSINSYIQKSNETKR